ncbi:nuclear transport factor 2 family protein [uncultured Limnohabitans sp.]|jgi:ketosteroid isomerase-like protein|uniref:nuclear transport factor 2 family protein n=1 Tax=uncultured Limnohabitans sp. TaxID=768543 RepID=UPI002623F36B|nr:nuclear transport factor 2 family protein [uncultured Limnohabitans sp.]
MSTDALRDQIRAQVRTALGAGRAKDDPASVAALMRRFEQGYEMVSAEAIVACFAPDVVWTLPDSRVLRGREACRAFLKERFASPTGPKFSDSHMNVLGQTVVQNYKVGVPLPGGQSVTLDGTDVYQIRDGLIAVKDAYWKQIGAPKPAAAPAPAAPAAASANTPATGPQGVVVPLRVGTAAQAASLTDLFKRLAASPALLQAAQSGLLRFDMRVDEAAVKAVAASAGTSGGASAMAATTAINPAACCPSCKEGKACECKSDTCDMHDHKEDVPELQGVIGEKLLKTLPASVKTVRIHPKAVLTPLGKEALRKRGITIDRGATA